MCDNSYCWEQGLFLDFAQRGMKVNKSFVCFVFTRPFSASAAYHLHVNARVTQRATAVDRCVKIITGEKDMTDDGYLFCMESVREDSRLKAECVLKNGEWFCGIKYL